MMRILAVLEPIIFVLTKRWAWFARFVNRILINGIVMSARTRPHPWSTKTSYICWSSLFDKTFSARFLPEADLGSLGSDAEIAELFVRNEMGQILCDKSTSLFPAFAQYLTDGFIRTLVSNNDDLTDRRRTSTNHEIDMCPLYGRTEAQTRVLRLGSSEPGRRGRLKSQHIGPEEFPPFLYNADDELVPGFDQLDPPLGLSHVSADARRNLFAVGGDRANATVGVAMINTLFLREHNRVASIIEQRNIDWNDDRVFEVTRNIIIVMFIKIVVEEYINHISPSRISFIADPSGCWRGPWNKPNWITAEFSLLYRWHSLVPDVIQWGGQQQNMADLRFANDKLIAIGLSDAFVRMSAQPAAKLGIGNTAKFLQDVEKDAIKQARQNKIAGYADYREAVGMSRPKTWEDVSSDPNVRARLAAAYPRGVDSLEFYVGLFAEDTVPNSPLPPLILRMVAIDAFSQALPNPLLSEHVWGDPTNRQAAFTELGIAEIEATHSLRDILARNSADAVQAFIGMTRPEWKRDSRLQSAA